MRDRSEKTAEARSDAHRNDTVKSLMRALAIVNRLAGADEGLTLTLLANLVNLPPSTTHRLLTTLEQERYVQFDPIQRVWSVGLQAFVVGAAYARTRNLASIARPLMRVLMEESRETVNLAIQDHGEAISLLQIESRGMKRALAKPGIRFPLYCSSLGKALLASMREEDLGRILPGQNLRKLTERTKSTRSELETELRLTRERGYAIDDEEHAVGLRCVAAPIFDESGQSIAALSISGDAARMAGDVLPRLGDLVRRKASEITARLGGVADRSR